MDSDDWVALFVLLICFSLLGAAIVCAVQTNWLPAIFFAVMWVGMKIRDDN